MPADQPTPAVPLNDARHHSYTLAATRALTASRALLPRLNRGTIERDIAYMDLYRADARREAGEAFERGATAEAWEHIRKARMYRRMARRLAMGEVVAA